MEAWFIDELVFYRQEVHCPIQWKKRKRLRLRNPPMASLGKLFS